MLNLSLSARAEHYQKANPAFPPLSVYGRWVYGIWMLGNNYRNKNGYYGEYPPGYLRRVLSLFPDAEKTLHAFSGSVPPGNYDRIDSNRDRHPEIVCRVEDIPLVMPEGKYDLILADPPYSAEDARRYNTPMINRRLALRGLVHACAPGGFICWLDTTLPMFRKRDIQLVGTIGIIRSTNHRVRMLSIFQRQHPEDSDV